MPRPQRIVFASGNAGKAREIRALFAELYGDAVELVLQGDLGIESVEETGTTFLENALLKARHAAAASGLPALADDSGIEVDALDGAPGVYSARFAGVDATDLDNVARLLDELRDVDDADRSARFRCVLAFVRSAADSSPLIAEGAWEGTIARAPAGDGGFGYDPVFIDNASGLRAAELPPATKNARSHRGHALRALRGLLPAERF
ncbi:MAG: RdgB/HAM1 family non-canonical purine NTP pyrophosphatase [Gammaproteobacteria bacterium]|jgi:XTP/dITP diphosphohydrolase